MTGMTDKRNAFVREYLKDFNATQAAIRAGYSPRSARRSGYLLLHHPDMQTALQTATQRACDKADVTVDRVLQELSRIAFGKTTDLLTISKQRVTIRDTETLTDDEKALLAEVAESEHGIRIKSHDKVKALELLGKYLAMFTDRVEATGADGGPLVVVRPPEPKS